MTKNIWIFHHYADPPDGHWTGTYDLYKFLVRKGHSVTVFSSSFSHYSRKEERLKDGEKSRVAYYDGMRFVFVRTAPHSKNDWRRLLNMLTYGIRSYSLGCGMKEHPDIVVGATPHPFCVLAAVLVAGRKKSRFFLELHDLWLEFILDTGMLSRKNPLSAMIYWMDKMVYRKAERIFTLWPNMVEYLKQVGVPEDKVVWMPLGIDFEHFTDLEYKPKKPDEPFTVICTARFGPASNVYEILQAARILKNEGRDNIKFLLFGAGPESDNLIKFVKDNDLKNVEFPGLVPKKEIWRHISASDICIAGLPDIPNYRKYGTIPTKLIDYLSSGRPVIFISMVKDNLVERASAGICVFPNDPMSLAEAIKKIAGMSYEERLQMGKNGVNYLRKNHDLKMLADRLESFF